MSKEMSHEAVKQQALNYRWVVLVALLFSFAAYAIVFQMVPPLLGGLQAEFV